MATVIESPHGARVLGRDQPTHEPPANDNPIIPMIGGMLVASALDYDGDSEKYQTLDRLMQYSVEELGLLQTDQEYWEANRDEVAMAEARALLALEFIEGLLGFAPTERVVQLHGGVRPRAPLKSLVQTLLESSQSAWTYQADHYYSISEQFTKRLGQLRFVFPQ